MTDPRLSVRRTTLLITLPLALTRSTETLTLRSPLTLIAICSPAPYARASGHVTLVDAACAGATISNVASEDERETHYALCTAMCSGLPSIFTASTALAPLYSTDSASVSRLT